MGLLPLTYTRPKHVPQESFSMFSIATTDDGGSDKETSPRSDGSVRSGQSGQSGIPDSLTFDRIINGGTCPPMTLRDFMNYLVYIEHSAENLQFYLWYNDYCRRFEAIPASEKALAPEWTLAIHEETVAKIRKDTTNKRRPEVDVAQQIFKGSDFDKQAGEAFSPPSRLNMADHQSVRTPPGSRHSEQTTCYAPSRSGGTTDYKAQASDAFHSAGATQPFTIQPFRDEINRVIATYIMYSSPRQLNLSSWEQKAAVQALSQTTHPTALRGLVKGVESSLRGQSHPKFVRWSICNGNPARVTFARGLGLFLIVAGFAMAVVLTLSSLGRGYRAFAALAWVLGISTLVAAWKGMCVVLHGLHHRHMRPWELFEQDDASMAEEEKLSKGSFESFGSSNSYEDEPWVVKYQKRNVVRKIFDREIWIQEPALRQIQDIIFVQALLSGALCGGLLTMVFVLVPGPKLF